MIVLFWCESCHLLHAPGEVTFPDDAGSTSVYTACARSGQPVEFRGIPDDPDDPDYGLPRCPTCRAELRPNARFCPRCGTPIESGPPGLPNEAAPAEPEQPGPAAGYRNSAQVVVEFARQRVHRQQVAAILELLADPPNYRQRPLPGDMAGDFDAWFDGGAVRYQTNVTEYQFADRSRASFHDLVARSIQIELPDGARVAVAEPPAQPSWADRVLAAVLAECQQILQPLQEQDASAAAGRPPSQCMIVENTASGGRQEWLYDLAANRLAPYPLGILDMSREPLNGMYYERALIQYQAVDDRRALEFSCVLGPRFGRGLRFELIDDPAGARLERPAVLWVS